MPANPTTASKFSSGAALVITANGFLNDRYKGRELFSRADAHEGEALTGPVRCILCRISGLNTGGYLGLIPPWRTPSFLHRQSTRGFHTGTGRVRSSLCSRCSLTHTRSSVHCTWQARQHTPNTSHRASTSGCEHSQEQTHPDTSM